MPLLITASDLGDRRVRLALSGEVDCATVPKLRDAINEVLQERNPRTIYVDIADVKVLDSMGIRALRAAYMCARDVCVRLVVVNANVFFTRVLQVVGLARLLGVYESAEDDQVEELLPVPAPRTIRMMR